MNAMRGRVLVVDDDVGTCEALEERLTRRGFAVVTRTDAREALLTMEAEAFDVVLTDLNLRGQSGLWLCEQVVGSWPDVPVILITAFGSLQTAIGAIRAGAWDFITKPFDLEVLALALGRAARHRQLRDEVRRLRSAAASTERFEEILGSSPAMRQVFALLDRVADTDSTVLVTGESGTGKELVARALHRRSRRASAAFVAVNCAAVPENLLESELFGHVKGAFTDARSARKGLFQQAHGGTLFLDEIGELPLAMQPKLLRALQERVVRPVGGDRDAPFDVRLIAATNRDLEAEVAAGRFRSDLFYRINVIPVPVPPLRARGGDVLLLAQRFVEKFAARGGRAVTGVSPEAAQALLGYDWPGNVRELENAMERSVALARGGQVALQDLPERVRERGARHVIVTVDEPSDIVPLEEMERRYILRVLDAVGGNKKLAAQALGVDRSTLYRKLDRFGGGTPE